MGRGRLVGTTFLPMINSLAAPSHVYHTTAQTDPTGIEPGPHSMIHSPSPTNRRTHDLAILQHTKNQLILKQLPNQQFMVTFIGYWSLKCLFSAEESSFVPMALCPVGTGSLTLRTDTLFTPALKRGRSFYLIMRRGSNHCQTHLTLNP